MYLPPSSLLQISLPSHKVTPPPIAMLQSFNHRTETLTLASKSRKCIFANVGIPAWSIEWCPGTTDSDGIDIIIILGSQYLAIAGFRTLDTHPAFGVKSGTSPGAIQIWKFKDGEMKFTYCLCHEFGDVLHLKWNPGGFDVMGGSRLGNMAVTFGDGSVRVACLPHPSFIPQDSHCKPII